MEKREKSESEGCVKNEVRVLFNEVGVELMIGIKANVSVNEGFRSAKI